MEDIEHLKAEIARKKSDLEQLEARLAAAEAEHTTAGSDGLEWKWPLASQDYQRYSRQMIVPGFGLEGQLRLRKSRVLLVGAGGLGCPAAAYLAGAGVGTLGLVDGDTVETSNLHRQVAHATARVGVSKVESAITFLTELNPSVKYQSHIEHLTPQNAEEIVSQYDIVLDCTDHPTSRYLISDICVLLGKPLVSASAFQTSGQLIVLNNPPGSGPCYRCVFPKPPPPESVVGCGEGGILGPVVGAMGVLQALEALKMIARGDLTPSDPAAAPKPPTLLLFSGWGETSFRTVKMRGRRADCFACATEGGMTLAQLRTSMDYVQFCGVVAPVDLLEKEERVAPEEYAALTRRGGKHVLLDVREKEHFEMCHLDGAINLPFSKVTRYRGNDLRELLPEKVPADIPLYVVCHQGNDSQVVAQKLKEQGLGDDKVFVGDIAGGMKAWKSQVDPTIPYTMG